MVRHAPMGLGHSRKIRDTCECTWSSGGEVEAWAGLCHVFRAPPGCMIIPDIADLPCEGQVTVVVFHKVVGDPPQTVQCSFSLSGSCVPLQGGRPQWACREAEGL